MSSGAGSGRCLLRGSVPARHDDTRCSDISCPTTARTLRAKGEDALVAEDLKQAAMTRVAGFEIMPAPYVIAHWQVGHALRAAGAPLGQDERAAVYLTNALTGWAAPQTAEAPDAVQRGIRYTYPQLAVERDEAARVKQARPILVVIGNPPYNAFAGTSPAEESGLVEPYKAGLQQNWGIRKFNLDDLYVRFFRVAERRIADSTGRGIICFISNHSWLRYLSYVVMRQRLLTEFDPCGSTISTVRNSRQARLRRTAVPIRLCSVPRPIVKAYRSARQ